MRIAVIQLPGAELAAWRETLALIDDLVAQAAARQAELAVLPECAWPAYMLGSRAEFTRARSAGLPGHDYFVAHLRQLAARHQLRLCAGYVEEDGHGELRNAAALVTPDGHAAVRYKSFLWAADRDYFTAGRRLEPLGPAFDQAGIMICADARLPEIPATLVARGARLLLQPTAWVNAGSAEAPWNPQPEFLIPARAGELGVPIASASKWGRERDTTFVGGSLICDGHGAVLARCGPAETAVATADVHCGVPAGPVLTPAERRELLAPTPPHPTRSDVPPLVVQLYPSDADAAWITDRLLTRSLALGPVLAVCAGNPSELRSTPARPQRGPWALLTGPGVPGIDLAGVRIESLRAEDAARFAPARVAALAGTHVLIVFGEGVRENALRARAAENRVFLLQVSSAGWCVLDPAGQFAARGGWRGQPRLTLDCAQAAQKQVAPGTDVLADREPAEYQF